MPEQHPINSILDFFSLLQRDRARSLRSSELAIDDSLRELRSEIDELELAFRQQGTAEFKSELGDVLWVVLFTMIQAEELKLFRASEVIETAIAKLNRRKPWLLDGDVPTREEEARLWDEGKRQERTKAATRHRGGA